jgi:hypothetical protein
MSRGSSVGIVTRLRAGRPGLESLQGQSWDIFLFATAFRPALGPTKPPTQWVLVIFTSRVRRPGREANHSPQSSSEFKNA